MNKAQYLALLAALAVFLALYLGFDTKPPAQKVVERSRSLQGEGTSFESLLDAAKTGLDAGQSAGMLALEQRLEQASSDTAKAGALKQLSAWWYAQGNLPVAGGFAEQVAELENADTAWSVAGATFYLALSNSQEANIRQYCGAHAVKAFESAISLNPGRVEHRVNLALVYAENPPPENPMQAVVMLRELEQKYPDNASVYNALGRLAIKTGQWERAVERLEKSWSLDKNNPFTPCLLTKAYQGAGKQDKAAEFAALCNQNK
ncbi:MAG: hypothetical protein L6Q97_26850 [Thermoanaerobaculia bacterium]|nr:hypothetical protein [Thermoanaerobaculia bacterium]